MSQLVIDWFKQLNFSDSTSPKSSIHLPNELLRMVVEYVETRKDLLSLRITSKIFQLEAERKLYSSLDVIASASSPAVLDTNYTWILDPRSQMKLYKTIESPRLSHIVTTLCVELPRCPQTQVPSTLVIQLLFSCYCDALDASLGSALRVLTNLSVLRIDCHLCRKGCTGTRRHMYLKKLSTRSLSKLSLFCICAAPEINSVLFSPVLNSVHTLEWRPYISPVLYSDISLKGDSTLLNLKRLPDVSPDLLLAVLPIRPITHIRIHSWSNELHEAAKASIYCGSLQRIFLFSPLNMPALFTGMLENIQPYRNLQHFGRLAYLYNCPPLIFEFLDKLAILPKLSIIDVAETGMKKPEWDPNSNQDFLLKLQSHLPTLTRICLTIHESLRYKRERTVYFVWEFKELWECHVASPFTF